VQEIKKCRRGPTVNKSAKRLILGRGQPAGMEIQ
jgi:hypothetical protein